MRAAPTTVFQHTQGSLLQVDVHLGQGNVELGKQLKITPDDGELHVDHLVRTDPLTHRLPSEVALPPGFSVYADEMQRVVGKLA
jgi:hypothetical protein